MKKRAFTLIELIMVVLVIGILATGTSQMLKRNTRGEAINHILEMIRYTQNLALHDSKHDRTDPKWQRSFWRFQIYRCANNSGLYYQIGTDKNFNKGIGRSETAIDPSNGKFTFWETNTSCPKNSTDSLNEQVSPNIFLTQRYGINKVDFKSCSIRKNGSSSSTAKHIGFDNFGRPIKSYTKSTLPDYWGHVVGDCNITFSFENKNKPFTIIIKAESGYAYLEENDNL